MRALCSGKTLAFQANDASSILAARSKASNVISNLSKKLVRKFILNEFQLAILLTYGSSLLRIKKINL